MFTDRTLGLSVPRDVHALIDWIDDRPEVARKLQALDRESRRQELRTLAQPLVEARRATPLAPASLQGCVWPTR
jgi:hypothetical protein